jgi:hypothetical protein
MYEIPKIPLRMFAGCDQGLSKIKKIFYPTIGFSLKKRGGQEYNRNNYTKAGCLMTGIVKRSMVNGE